MAGSGKYLRGIGYRSIFHLLHNKNASAFSITIILLKNNTHGSKHSTTWQNLIQILIVKTDINTNNF